MHDHGVRFGPNSCCARVVSVVGVFTGTFNVSPQLPISSNLFDTFGGGGATANTTGGMNAMGSGGDPVVPSCPTNIKESRIISPGEEVGSLPRPVVGWVGSFFQVKGWSHVSSCTPSKIS